MARARPLPDLILARQLEYGGPSLLQCNIPSLHQSKYAFFTHLRESIWKHTNANERSTALKKVGQLIEPPDLKAAFEDILKAYEHGAAFAAAV